MTTLLQAVMAATLAGNGVADPPPEPLAARVDVLGLQVCLGALDDGKPCDVRLLAPRASSPAAMQSGGTKPASTSTTAQPQPKLEPFEISLLGHTVCMGHVTGDPACDLTLFPSKRAEAVG